MSTLGERLSAEMKDAMRAGDKPRLGVIRMLQAAIKQREIDEQTELDEAAKLAIVEKQVKQRRDAAVQYREGGREELAEQEDYEAGVLAEYLPQALDAAELDALLEQAVSETGAAGMADMGKVMAWLKPKVAGRADMGQLSAKVRERLS
ncbi:GatB/YqeY domain-containing protein [Algiphilus aromaticivorans]|uniref:GatB/YqeY domain-containing protein n=1 Tax=Algiphilus aromaticivorans TaxID=382454 RepID=UPI0005C1C401|nr:GatB/YqeY domain-containing protein [Algiphilus aromaticivorans]